VATRSLIHSAILSVLAAAIAAGSALAETRGVKIESKTRADYIASQPGRAWAVVIGIDEFEHMPPLKYAVADARAMADLLGQQGFQVTTLYNRQATRDAVLKELGDRLLERTGDQDRVLVFYAGHAEDKYLLPVEGRPDALARTGISMGLIRDMADALPVKQFLFLVGMPYGGVPGQPFRTPPAMSEDYFKLITRERGRQVITAGGVGHQATEGPEWGHSVFTHYLLEGLGKGLADLNKDGVIPASELFSYLDSRVSAAAQKKGQTQRPEMWALVSDKGEFVFAPGKKAGASVAAPGAGAGEPSDEVARLRQKLEALRAQVSKQKAEEAKALEEARARPPEAPRQAVENFIEGNYWALLIGINTYPAMGKEKQLEAARKGAEAVAALLVERYGFSKDRMIALYDEEASRKAIIKAFSRLKRDLTEKDSLFVYFAGHGDFEPVVGERKEKGMGYWLPSDAEPDDPSNYVFNSQIKDFLVGIKARHIYVVADSAFSTSLIGRADVTAFTRVAAKQLYQKKSRWILASDTLFPVPDLADKNKKGHSAFAWHFLKILENNISPYLLVKDIAEPLAIKVSHEAQGQLPRSAPVIATGDEGGQFVFQLSRAFPQ
jgi:uncharacterized caspase-like protein